MTTPRNVLEEWPPSRWDDYCTGWSAGYLEGLDRGRALADAEAAARHRAAADVVLAMTRTPEVDRAESAARRARIDARFAAKGGA
ncbi:hypothetical protein B277_03945 [Janibacter hoylei PVAS-1]|uniref:Uncharacterized protein n=1 Tax=Janibacter hoylei PVAS-1 TaxID=1210046 RepID=K1E0H6_9MICO|nr:hypothetical protein [Janibacter hoylei]EKA62169.1 hypothetical protein B277_03945 [Janibacter hoylei PVAS-1]RWU85108.1 hypothetical protein CWN80_02875 [Janibacter hoylei PVAS-1]